MLIVFIVLEFVAPQRFLLPEYVGVFVFSIYIYYCMTGRAIWGNIQLEGGSIGPSAARDNTEPES